MQEPVCDRDGVCEADEPDSCPDCAKNLAGQLALAEPRPVRFDTRILVAAVVILGVVALELSMLLRRH